ncbi:hypothetical protein SAMN05444411_102258 [Lutibacter oricola]|uniref:Secretion system C-terminal sorting domain-containing protein n=1 Tax=Lutibacter oricola TaxID=762486 RepID=A0A1H2WQ62_9FLAO|nr:T9SS type A sorting domain-containing protein [Lutibacter oricola]SDW82772.1 hypothetical protein SAMN05444411_102258 [Lutibacter oricola]
MKKYYFLLLSCCFMMAHIQAQNNCEINLEKAKLLLEKDSPFSDQSELISLLEPCAVQGYSKSENYLGLVYLNGIGTEKNVDKAFTYISSAANKDYANAQYNLGRLYKYGIGCSISFKDAVNWFEIASQNGNQRAAYSLGYMYFKGYGVQQDYQKAVYWFERSEDAMAKHFLAISYYFGYGVSANENKALELLLSNPTINSETFVTYIKANQKQLNEVAVEEALDTNISTDSTHIESEIITDVEVNEYSDFLTTDTIEGEWTGKLIQYDWSGNYIVRILPVSIDFVTNNNNIEIIVHVNNQELKSSAQFQDGNVYVDDLTFTLKKLYSSVPNELSLDYTLFTLNLQEKEYLGNTYLTGMVDTFIDSWTEYGQPMSVVLKPKGVKTEIDDEILEALAVQKDQFIKLYPVPFNEQLTVQYELETVSDVYVELININGTNKTVIQPIIKQQAGEYTYSINVDSSLPEGLYVVRLKAGNQLYTRLIVKEY